MKAHLNTNLVNFEVEAQNQKEMFKMLAEIQDVFAEQSCGLCGKADIRFSVRTIQENDYYEMTCISCGGKLSFGQMKKGNKLFPIRKLDEDGKPDRENGKFGKHRGWTKYRGTPKKDQKEENEIF